MEQKLTSAGSTLYCETVNPNAPTVILIHNMWGSYKTMHRHVKLFNELGYNTVSFNLTRASRDPDSSPIHGIRRWRFTYSLWIDHITDVLNSVDGQKIIFSFSGPSLSGLIATHDRTDILAYICDGGPFEDVWACTVRMFRQETKIPTEFLRKILVTFGVGQWGPFAVQHLHECLSQWAPAIPILSVRGCNDPIVPPESIAAIFSPHPQLSLSVLDVPRGFHLDGLKNHSQIYVETITGFLKKNIK